jgi:hypothetical protein
MGETLCKESVAAIGPRVFALLPPIFRECVGKNHKYSIELPFVIGDTVYATNGNILVRTRASSEVAALLAAIEGRKILDKAATVADGETWQAEPTPLPFVSDPEPCTQCTVCIHCGMRAGCWDCDHTGFAWMDFRVRLAPMVWIGHRYAHLLKRHGAAVYLPTVVPDRPIRFVVGDVVGFLMPLKKED